MTENQVGKRASFVNKPLYSIVCVGIEQESNDTQTQSFPGSTSMQPQYEAELVHLREHSRKEYFDNTLYPHLYRITSQLDDAIRASAPHEQHTKDQSPKQNPSFKPSIHPSSITMHVLLLGGHGKIALHLTPLLLNRAWSVTSVVRNADHESEILALGQGRKGKLDVLISSLDDVKGAADAQRILDTVDPDYVVWSAGTLVPLPPHIDRSITLTLRQQQQQQ